MYIYKYIYVFSCTFQKKSCRWRLRAFCLILLLKAKILEICPSAPEYANVTT